MSQAAAPSAPPSGPAIRIGYGVGAITYGIALYALSGQVLQIYFNQVLGLPAVAVGAALMVTILVDAVIDPLIGWWSDGLRTPLGRRHVLMYASAIPAALGIFFLWHQPAGLDATGLMVFMIGMLLFVRVACSLFEIRPWRSPPNWPPAMTSALS